MAESAASRAGDITAEVTLPVSPMSAFTGFTAKMNEWWDPLLTDDPATFTGVAIDPDGPVEMVHGAESYECGRVIVWDPPGAFAEELWLGHDPAHPSTLSVEFAEAPEGTLVRLTHGGWTADNAATRARYEAWPDLLRRYAAAVVN